MTLARNLASLLLGALLVAGCSKPAPEPAPTPMPTVAATPVPLAGVVIRAVEIGRGVGGDSRVTDATTTFKPTDTIYAVVLTEGTSTAATIAARFVYGPDNQLVNESSRTIAPVGPAATEFHVSKPDGWPAGTYAVEISLDGGAPQRTEFKVE